MKRVNEIFINIYNINWYGKDIFTWTYWQLIFTI
jgi:hypothetical protein